MLSAGFGRSQSRGWLWVSESGVLSSVTFSTGTAGVAQGPNVNPPGRGSVLPVLLVDRCEQDCPRC